jgi:hypothetical protein
MAVRDELLDDGCEFGEFEEPTYTSTVIVALVLACHRVLKSHVDFAHSTAVLFHSLRGTESGQL